MRKVVCYVIKVVVYNLKVVIYNVKSRALESSAIFFIYSRYVLMLVYFFLMSFLHIMRPVVKYFYTSLISYDLGLKFQKYLSPKCSSIPGHLLLLQHNPVYTTGIKSTSKHSLKLI